MPGVSRRPVVTSIIQDVHLTVAHRLFLFGRQLSFLRCKDSFPKSSFAQETHLLTLDYRINSTSVSQQGCENKSSGGDVKPRWMHANQSFASLLITLSALNTLSDNIVQAVFLSIDYPSVNRHL